MQQLPKMSDKTQPFVAKVMDYAKSNPEFAPSYLNVDELDIDMKAVHDLAAILQVVQPLCDNLNDTEMMSGSEAYKAAQSRTHVLQFGEAGGQTERAFGQSDTRRLEQTL